MKAKDWLKRKAAMIALSMGNLEKNVLSQNGEQLSSDVNQVRRHTQGQLMDSLINGVVTEEVQNLRWRMYKTLEASRAFRIVIMKDKNGKPLYDDEGNVRFESKKIDNISELDGVKLDSFDTYPLQMLIDNAEITLSLEEAMGMVHSDKAIKNKDLSGDTISATHGVVSSKELDVLRPEKPVTIIRDFLPSFSIENFTEKLVVRKINETQSLLEFYVSKYPDEENRTTRLFISEIKKATINPRQSNMLDIKGVSFVTFNSIGAENFLEYEYKVLSFDKIIEFGGHYVIKFIGEVTINGKSLIEDYRMDELDEKYKKKEKRKKK